jgi:pilus assembly protein CpaE
MLSKFTKTGKDEGASVDLVTADPVVEQLVHEALARDERFAPAGTFRTLAEAESGMADRPMQAILLVHLDPGQPGDIAAMDRIMNGVAKGRSVIAIIDALTESAVRRLLHLRVSDLLSRNSPAEELLRACERAIRPENGSSRFTGARCFAFISAGGGAGNTTLAIQSAFLMARRTRQYQSTCIIDMDLQGGAVADYLDVTANLQLDEVAPSPDRLDTHLLEVMLSRHPTGLAVLAAENALRPYDAVSGDWVTRLLDMASIKFENIVIDMPRVWLPWSENVLRGSDRVFIVTEMTVPGLRQARRLLDAITKLCGADVDISVIVNRFSQSFFGGVNAVRRKDAEELLGERLAGCVAEDYRLVREAIDRGVPLYEVAKGNRIDKDLEAILSAERTQAAPGEATSPLPRAAGGN